MLTLKTNCLMMTVLLSLSTMAYSDYFVKQSCINQNSLYSSQLQQCQPNSVLPLDEFKPSFPH